MKKICLCFQIHQPYRLRRYRFFDIGNSHYYSDDYLNEEVFERIADTCYLPANRMLLELLKAYPDFSVSFSLSGLAIEQMEYYKPELIDSFKELVATGRVELLAESYAHSISSLYDSVEFRNQVRMQQTKLRELFGVSPSRVFCNTELIYSDDIALELSALGYEGIITEGAKHVLGWKSPNYLYTSAVSPKTTLLLRNANLTELITSHFSNYASAEYPVTADKLLGRVKWLPEGEDFVCLYMNYEVLGVMNRPETGIFEFFRALPALAGNYEVSFTTPSRLLDEEKSVGALSVAYPISWAGEEKSTNEWNGNILQQGAIVVTPATIPPIANFTLSPKPRAICKNMFDTITATVAPSAYNPYGIFTKDQTSRYTAVASASIHAVNRTTVEIIRFCLSSSLRTSIKKRNTPISSETVIIGASNVTYVITKSTVPNSLVAKYVVYSGSKRNVRNCVDNLPNAMMRVFLTRDTLLLVDSALISQFFR